jgi:hypothetical protein
MAAKVEQVERVAVVAAIHLVAIAKDLFMVTTFTLYHKVDSVVRTMLMLR